MTNPMTAGLAPTHPGELLREVVIPAVRESKTEIAAILGMSRQHLHAILTCRKNITIPMALRLAKMFGGSAESWLRMQLAYELRIEEAAMADELARIPELTVA